MDFTSDYFLGSAFFTLGCLSFTIDAFKQKERNYYLISGSLLFDIGCVFFIKDSLS